MVSKNERFRIERQMAALTERNDRQKNALTRMGLALTEMTAALAEIADMANDAPSFGLHDATERAQTALDSVASQAAAVGGDKGESTQDPKEGEEV